MHFHRYSFTVILLLLAFVTACEPGNDVPTPTPGPQPSNILTSWKINYYSEQPDGQWLRENGSVYNFRYHTDGSIHIIDIGDTDRVYYRDTMVYDQGKFIGVKHDYLDYKFIFGSGRLRSVSLVIPGSPGTPNGVARQSEHLYYRSDGKIDSTVGKNALNSGDTVTRTRSEYTWKGEDLQQIKNYYRDDKGFLAENNTDTFEYEDRLLPFSFSNLPEGMEFFILNKMFIFRYFHFYSKHLIKSSVRTWVGSTDREVTNWTHRFDDKNRWIESSYTTIRYENNVKTDEWRHSISYGYKN